MVFHCICMVSDFFHPNQGGVESHIYQLSQCLMRRGHRVVVITHLYGDRVGVRYLTSGLKVYYLPVPVFYNQCTLPATLLTFPLIRNILIREQVTIVHGHSAFSVLAHDAIFHAKVLGLKTVFTDHSLFGFADASAIITNKLLQVTLSICNQVICVSHTGKENTALRANVNPHQIYVIPNAVDTSLFIPDPSQRDPSKVTLVMVSRLVYRKGVDLLAEIIPQICCSYPEVNFIIAGDGPKRIVLEEVREHFRLQDRVTMLGSIDHDQVKDVLVKGHIFINASLTEAFCMAIVEAVSCGLHVVSTNIGGIPEVLPPDLVTLTEPTSTGLLKGIQKAISNLQQNIVIPPHECHSRIKSIYQWNDVATRTEMAYNKLAQDPQDSLSDLLTKIGTTGTFCGPFFMLVLSLLFIFSCFFAWLNPKELIDKALPYHHKSISCVKRKRQCRNKAKRE